MMATQAKATHACTRCRLFRAKGIRKSPKPWSWKQERITIRHKTLLPHALRRQKIVFGLLYCGRVSERASEPERESLVAIMHAIHIHIRSITQTATRSLKCTCLQMTPCMLRIYLPPKKTNKQTNKKTPKQQQKTRAKQKYPPSNPPPSLILRRVRIHSFSMHTRMGEEEGILGYFLCCAIKQTTKCYEGALTNRTSHQCAHDVVYPVSKTRTQPTNLILVVYIRDFTWTWHLNVYTRWLELTQQPIRNPALGVPKEDRSKQSHQGHISFQTKKVLCHYGP